jgi:hypothetical protein
MSAITSYGLWFWAHGIDTVAECDQRNACGGLDIFVFTPLKAKSGTARALNLILAVGASLYYGVMTLTAAAAGVFVVYRGLQGRRELWNMILQPAPHVALDRRE